MSLTELPLVKPEAPSAQLTGKSELEKQYESLVTQKDRALKRPGDNQLGWYWQHFDIVYAIRHDNGQQAVKLECKFCGNRYQPSNPSRLGPEHLRTCTAFKGELPPKTKATPAKERKRSADIASAADPAPAAPAAPQTYDTQDHQLQVAQELKQREKKVKASGRAETVAVALPKANADNAYDALCELLYEACGSIPLSMLQHPQFLKFCECVGISPPARVLGATLDAKYLMLKQEIDRRLVRFPFFQLAAEGWREVQPWYQYSVAATAKRDNKSRLANICINQPSGGVVFHKAVELTPSDVHQDRLLYALSSAIMESTGCQPQRCLGVVSDAEGPLAAALKSLEEEHTWMMNLPCVATSLDGLMQDLAQSVEMVSSVLSRCVAAAELFQHNAVLSTKLLQALAADNSMPDVVKQCGVRLPPGTRFLGCVETLLDLFQCQNAVQVALAYPDTSRTAAETELVDQLLASGWWSTAEVVKDLLEPIAALLRGVEADKPLVSECLGLWAAVRAVVSAWGEHSNEEDAAAAMAALERRQAAAYHPVWSAALLLDPMYLLPASDEDERYLPNWGALAAERQRDAEAVVRRVALCVSLPDSATSSSPSVSDASNSALGELLLWRLEGCASMVAKIAQMKDEPGSADASWPRVPSAQIRRAIWETYLQEKYPTLSAVAVRILSLQAVAVGPRQDTMAWRAMAQRSPAWRDVAAKMLYISSNRRLARRELSSLADTDNALRLPPTVYPLNLGTSMPLAPEGLAAGQAALAANATARFSAAVNHRTAAQRA